MQQRSNHRVHSCTRPAEHPPTGSERPPTAAAHGYGRLSPPLHHSCAPTHRDAPGHRSSAGKENQVDSPEPFVPAAADCAGRDRPPARQYACKVFRRNRNKPRLSFRGPPGMWASLRKPGQQAAKPGQPSNRGIPHLTDAPGRFLRYTVDRLLARHLRPEYLQTWIRPAGAGTE